ncbi:uncharacterized protein LOC136068684 [Quercus suber]|uniref:Uncharacterized protein n=1 Tax=Quercus suber TaxID=58331 RepID=A0AAW0JY99_QUESU|nr:uncharacterized protein LOC111996992 [Quercus suber]POE70209.1 hypothetical protein CFP56_63576 [Quercus suber]
MADSASGSGCSCFRLFDFRQKQSNDNESKHLLQQKGEHNKQVTGVLARLKWNTFMKKFSRFGFNKNKKEKNRFQYDPRSYALNFDDRFDNDEDALVISFTSRFAAPMRDHEEQRRTESGK